ncbi:uncharacterized protein HMPREF1541_01562 [Cyphellophora europaea CBS 101466]|uniref:histone acetyltransferase n=1 Tax=Cyphellophora europaea (strain CBS 101466) TaxID=1220924 RepID=W2S309_CYPE1|nr:uncharacterized protein HMPREF1541_01562 [Cyphellophora europaea CBS 101466]ETN42408.1 hypothetical protein HMPREF1541_01562 [Cyphellophora europaea CBS 101466]
MDAPGSTPNRRASLKILSRNIEQVVLGNMLFDTWYYSPYPDGIVLGPNAKNHSEARNGAGGIVNGIPLTKSGIVCTRLYVCPICFCYSPEEVDYAQHLMHHQEELLQGEVLPVPETAFKVYEWDGYIVWEVDGEAEKLYCQNLSLFAKLFLEQKSVFFDTGGFKYYVLTHTSSTSSGGARGRARKRASSGADDSLFKTKVLGFFSKENLSWDSNNLACILIFPPFQHRQLGQLLMAVSYKLSGWEWEGGVIGGPEKPLSSMGRKSYLRFWSERIARYLMGQTADADQHKVFDTSHRRKNGIAKDEMTVEEIGDRTGMLAEDVIAALNEMGVCDMKLPKRKKKTSNDANSGTAAAEAEEPQAATMMILRAKVLKWAEDNRVDLVPPVREEGFLGEWALSDVEDQEPDEDAEIEDSE